MKSCARIIYFLFVVCFLLFGSISTAVFAAELRGISLGKSFEEQQITQCSKNPTKPCYTKIKTEDKSLQYVISGLKELTFKTKTSADLVNGKVGIITINVLTQWKPLEFYRLLKAKYGDPKYFDQKEMKAAKSNETWIQMWGHWEFDDSKLDFISFENGLCKAVLEAKDYNEGSEKEMDINIKKNKDLI